MYKSSMMTHLEESIQFREILNQSARLLQQNRPGEALALLQPLYAQAPLQPDVAINLGGAYILQRKWNRAVAVLSKAVEAHPGNAMLWTNLAAAHLGRLELAGPKQQERAIAAYERVLTLDPKAPNVHYHLGLIYKERGELNRACAFFELALETDASDKDARYWLDKLTQLLVASGQARQRPEPEAKPTNDQGHGEQA
jgi:tetratricopeptide (TPR) repeat protein